MDDLHDNVFFYIINKNNLKDYKVFFYKTLCGFIFTN